HRVEEGNAHVLGDAEAAEGLRQLEAAGHAEPRALMRRKTVDARAGKAHGAALMAERAAEAVDEGAFARAAAPDEAKPPALRHAEADIVERAEAAELLAQLLDLEQRRRAHRRLPRRPAMRPTMPLGATITNATSSTPTISTLSPEEEENATVVYSWIEP